MAYYLQFDGVDDLVSTGVNIPFTDYTKLRVEIDVLLPSNIHFGSILEIVDIVTINYRSWVSDPTKVRVRGGTSDIYISTLVPENQRFILTIDIDILANTYNVYADNVLLGSTTKSAWSSRRLSFGTDALGHDLYGAKVYLDDVLTYSYDPSASNGTGSILPDIIGGNDGTLQNFPTDDSQWVFYSDSTGATADTDITISKPTFASTASATLPEPVANVTFTLPEPLFTASATASLPQPIASGNFTVTNLTFASTASATLPQPSASAEFTVTAPTFSASASATLPYPQATASFNIDKPTFAATGSATLPQPIADVTVTLTAPVFTATASATLPQPSASVNFATPSPQISVVAIVGGIEIIVDDETNINQRVLSNNINAPALSNNINAPALSNNING